MNKLFALLVLLSVVQGGLQSKCINNSKKHRKPKIARKQGVATETYRYKCNIKASEKDNFEDGAYCKNCGCHITEHDKESR